MQGDVKSGYHHGLHLFQTGRYKDAITAFRQVLSLKPESSETHLYLGRSFLGEGMSDEAAAEFKEAIRLHSDDRKTGYWLAIALMRSTR